MDEFLGDKAKAQKKWQIPVLILCLIFAVAGWSVVWDDIARGDTGDMWASLLLAALFMWPPIVILLDRARRTRAKKFASSLSSVQEETLPFDQLSAITGIAGAEGKLRGLLDKGYIKGLQMDMRENQVVFIGRSAKAAEETFAEMECPGCGAKNRVRVGRVGKCAFCDGTLIARTKNR